MLLINKSNNKPKRLMLLAYLSEPKDRLTELIAGMEKNAALWTNQSVTVQQVNEAIAGI